MPRSFIRASLDNCACEALVRKRLLSLGCQMLFQNVCGVRRSDQWRDANGMSFHCQIFVEFLSRLEQTKAKLALELRSHQFGTDWPKEIAEALNKVGKLLSGSESTLAKSQRSAEDS